MADFNSFRFGKSFNAIEQVIVVDAISHGAIVAVMKSIHYFSLVLSTAAFGLFMVPAQAVIIDGVDWTSTWEGNVTPANAPGTTANPSFSEFGGSFTVNSGTTTTAGTNAGAATPNPSSSWAGGTAGNGTDSTVEFRVRVLSQGSEVGQPYGTAFFTGWNGERFSIGLNSLGTKLVDFGGSNLPGTNTFAVDTTLWNVYRVVYFDSTNSASLYINGVNTGLTQSGSGGLADTVQFAKFTSEVSATGSSEWDYIRWTNAIAAVPIPEPNSLALLGLTLVFGAAAGRRRQ